MRKSSITIIFLCIFAVYPGQSAPSQERDAISAIPRVDVHSHVGSVERMGHYTMVAEVLKNRHGINLAVCIDLNFMRRPDGTEQEYLDAAANRFKGRFLPCINDFKISDGLRFSPEELVKWQEKGIVGYKIWVGVSALIDVPANDATFAKMEEIGMTGASIHISQPYPTRWCEDPVKFWQAHNAYFFDFVQRCRAIGIEVPILAGVMPIYSVKMMKMLAGMCGATITDEVRDGIASLPEDDKEALLNFGIDFATSQCSELLRAKVAGLHFYTMDLSRSTVEIVNRLRADELL